MYNDIIEIIKTWPVPAQFIFFFAMIFISLAIAGFIIHEIARFFNETLPIIIHGWDPTRKEDLEEDE